MTRRLFTLASGASAILFYILVLFAFAPERLGETARRVVDGFHGIEAEAKP